MTMGGKLKSFLDDQGLPYEILTHREVFAAGDEARAVGATAGNVAKTLVAKLSDGHDVLAIVPASEKLDIHKLRDAVNDNHARLATEQEIGHDFHEFELGAVPPLGELVDAPVLLDPELEKADFVVFDAGTHRDSVKMSGEDFLKLTHPQIVDLVKIERESVY